MEDDIQRSEKGILQYFLRNEEHKFSFLTYLKCQAYDI